MHKTTLQRSLGKIIIEENMPKPIKVTSTYGIFFHFVVTIRVTTYMIISAAWTYSLYKYPIVP